MNKNYPLEFVIKNLDYFKELYKEIYQYNIDAY